MAFNGIKKDRGLTTGNITLGLLWFAVPMILGNLLQQFYNIADTLIVGQFLGANALAAVGSAYSLMIFLTSIILRNSSRRLTFLPSPDRSRKYSCSAAASSFLRCSHAALLF